MSNGKQEKFLYESGDRWILDTLIPNSEREKSKPFERTSRLRVATKPVLVVDKLTGWVTPLQFAGRPETALDKQRRLRGENSKHNRLPDDVLLGD